MSLLHVQCTLLNEPRWLPLVVASLGSNRDVVAKLGYFSMMASFSVSTEKRKCRRSTMVLSGLTRWLPYMYGVLLLAVLADLYCDAHKLVGVPHKRCLVAFIFYLIVLAQTSVQSLPVYTC